MAKIVSAVPKLLTSTLAIAASTPKPAALPAPISVATPPVKSVAETPVKTSVEPVANIDLSENIGGIETRSRGRAGTIATSFRGVLNDGVGTLPRRTLLGE